MQYVLLFKGSCPACSEVAGMVNDLPVENLRAQAADSTEVAGILARAALPEPTGPVLLILAGDRVRMVSGWQMRRVLGRLIGWRRARTIVRLAAAEWRARLGKSATANGFTRRGIVRAGLAGLAGAAVVPATASVASARTAVSEPVMSIADQADVQRALKLPAVRTAIRSWGAVKPGAHLVTSGSEQVLVLVHGQGEIVSLVDNKAASPVVLGMGIAPGTAPGLRFYTPNGGAIADLTKSNGQIVASAASNHISPSLATSSTASPAVSNNQVVCFIGCLGRNVSASCVLNCFGCVSGGITGAIIDCPQCGLCAGPHAISCAKECFL